MYLSLFRGNHSYTWLIYSNVSKYSDTPYIEHLSGYDLPETKGKRRNSQVPGPKYSLEMVYCGIYFRPCVYMIRLYFPKTGTQRQQKTQ